MDGDDDSAAAAAELHRLLTHALARSRITKTQLVGLAGLSRSTIQAAFVAGAVPSAETAAALARVLRLNPAQVLDLRQRVASAAARPAAPPAGVGVGQPIATWHAHDLEVHPAGGSSRDGPLLPEGYVERAHDQVLADAVHTANGGRSTMVVLVGGSSTGKTRACWEAVQPLAEHGWRLWHPHHPARADAALADLTRVGPRTVVWLNEAQHYLGAPGEVGERIAAAVHRLLIDQERAPVLVLGTLWSDYARTYTQLPSHAGPDPHSRVRELLAGRTVAVPDVFDPDALRTADTLAEAGDRDLAATLVRARGSGRIAQDLAGAPELLRRYQEGTAAQQAVLRAAMDARRLGMGLHLPWAFLVDAAADYLDEVWNALPEDWAETALHELARPGHGAHAPLYRTDRPRRRLPDPFAPQAPPASTAAGPVYRLADYLDQHGRTELRRTCPPASFWETAAHTATPDEQAALAREARDRGRYRHAQLLAQRAAGAGNTGVLRDLAQWCEEAGDRDGIERLHQIAADAANTDALRDLAMSREVAGDRDGAEQLYRQAADAGNTDALRDLARRREEEGDRDSAEQLYRQAADAGNTDALRDLAMSRELAGDRDGAERLARQAADAGETNGLRELARLRDSAGDRDGAERLAREAADAGNAYVLRDLARWREEAGDRDSVEQLYRQAADAGNTSALWDLARLTATDQWQASKIVRYGWEPDGRLSAPW
ncbi:hypothetical protein [Streptomyces sp. NPDC055055]